MINDVPLNKSASQDLPRETLLYIKYAVELLVTIKGDVWDLDECQRFSSPALLKAQDKIKEQFHGNELKEYEQLHSIKPDVRSRTLFLKISFSL